MNLTGNFVNAELLYVRSIHSAKQHKFIHEEAMASELAGDFFYERGLMEKAYSFYASAVACYKEWGALAVAQRLETTMQSKIVGVVGQAGDNMTQSGPDDDFSEVIALALGGDAGSRKRNDFG